VQREINKNESIAPPGWCEGQKKEEKKREYYVCFFFFKNQFLLMEETIAKHLQQKKKRKFGLLLKQALCNDPIQTAIKWGSRPNFSYT
jgi:hypothetical protein